MLTALSGGYYTSPTRPMPPPTSPMQSASSTSSSSSNGILPGSGIPPSSPRSQPQVQYCDTCNTACVFMNGKRRKFQARYEGYVLVKRVSTRPFLPYVMLEGQQQQQQQQLLQQQQQQQQTAGLSHHLPSNMRRHSCGDMLDENGDANAVPHSPFPTSSCAVSSASVPALGGHRDLAHISPPASYNRSLSHPEWQRDDSTPSFSPTPSSWEKVVNIDENGSGQIERPSTTPVHTSPHTPENGMGGALRGDNSSVGGGDNSSVGGGGRKPRRHSAMMERLSGGHQRLCRKKSRSQDNLVGGRRGSGCGGGPLRLNNSVIPPPASLTSALSRSEGSIHNVHAVMTAVPISVDDVDVVGLGGLRAEVGELARLPKKLLHRVTGEVGQLVFDLEGWREEYLLLTNTAIAARTTNGFAEAIVPYSQIEDVHVVVPCGASGHKFCVRVVVRDGALLLQF